MKKYVKTNFCGIVIPSKKNNVLEFNQCMKSDKMPYIIYADMKSLIKKTNGCANNPEISLITKTGEHNSCGYSMSKNLAFNNKKSKHTLYYGGDYRKVRDHWHYTDEFRGAVHSICKLKFNVPNEIPVVFHDGSNCDYNFVIKELATRFKENFNVLGKMQKSEKPFFFNRKRSYKN